MRDFLIQWHEAALTSAGLFWMAFWAFGLGYLLSSIIQVFVTRERMKKSLGDDGASSVGLGAFFGFISSSCSFAALATTRSLFAKGAELVPSLTYLLASTNLVVELGIVIAIFLGWQFVVGEYLGGVLMILLMWLIVRLTLPRHLADSARKKARDLEEERADTETRNWKQLALSREGWRQVARRYVMEWHMVWKDVTIGFTVAGIIAAFVPKSFFAALFVGSGEPEEPLFWEVLLQSIVGPVAAFFTFIGSMGNIPLAAVLYDNGVSFAGIMAFIFSDLVVLPVLRVQAQYYGWRMALYILAVFFLIIVSSALIMHYLFSLFGLLPEAAIAESISERDYFSVDYTLFLNLFFIALSVFFLIWRWIASGLPRDSGEMSDRILLVIACTATLWLGLGLFLPYTGNLAG